MIGIAYYIFWIECKLIVERFVILLAYHDFFLAGSDKSEKGLHEIYLELILIVFLFEVSVIDSEGGLIFFVVLQF
jgi:hypothetical protein